MAIRRSTLIQETWLSFSSYQIL